MKKTSLYIAIIAIFFSFGLFISSAEARWSKAYGSPSCLDSSKLCFEFETHGAFGLSYIGWWGFATSSRIFNDATTSPLVGHHVLAYVSAYPEWRPWPWYYNCNSIDCDNPLEYRMIPLSFLTGDGFKEIKFVADKTGVCWENKDNYGFSYNDCIASGGVFLAHFDIRTMNLVANAFASSSETAYLDLVSTNPDIEFVFKGDLIEGYSIFLVALGGALVFVLIYGVLKYKA
jgi:hypothetical protein